MTPKIIHLCWFSNDPYPVEIKVCLESWQRVMPDYEVKIWRMEDARAIGMDYVNEALDARRWAFASDVIRFYAVYKYGGVYMDSDVYMYRSFNDLLDKGDFLTFNERIEDDWTVYGLQAACFMGAPGNQFCKDMVDYYASRHYLKPDGTFDNTISPYTMKAVAERYGYVNEDEDVQHLGAITVYPTHYLAPRKRYKIDNETYGQHRVYGSWRKRKFGRRLEIIAKHVYNLFNYYVLKKSK